MRVGRGLRSIGVIAAVGLFLPMTPGGGGSDRSLAAAGAIAASSTQAQHKDRRQAVVGFWAGETDEHCAASDPNYCPRNLSIYTPTLWRVLKNTHAVLYFDLVYQADYGPKPPNSKQRTDAIPLIRKANKLGVPVYAWMTFPVSDGTYADEQNASTVRIAVRDLVRWKRRHRLRIARLVPDLEQATGDQAVADALHGDSGPFDETARGNVDPAAQCRSMETYRRTISWAHRRGVPVDGTPVPFSMDDVVDDHNMGLTNVLDMPPYAPGMYDRIYVQAYQAEFGFEFGSGYVARYYRLIHRLFGRAGQVSLGNTGDPPYTEAGPLISDIRMLAGMGDREIPVFDLDAAVSSYGDDGVARVVRAGLHPLTGKELRRTEADITTQGRGALRLFATLNSAANAEYAAKTTSEGKPAKPNAWPNGCGHMASQPIRRH